MEFCHVSNRFYKVYVSSPFLVIMPHRSIDFNMSLMSDENHFPSTFSMLLYLTMKVLSAVAGRPPADSSSNPE